MSTQLQGVQRPEGLHAGISENLEYQMIVFCHLRWDFVYQRPQHIISRLSKDYKILFVEEPLGQRNVSSAEYNLRTVAPGIDVLQPTGNDMGAICEILQKLIPSGSVSIGWFYSAAFSAILPDINFEVIVYDCMDELTMFKGANEELIDEERFLLSRADIVFTGGRSLYESKSAIHANVYCFPSSVDQEHFANSSKIAEFPADIQFKGKPIVGYYGVIDERIDLELIREVAALLPAVEFVMIGPLAKIGEEELPLAPNIHFLGMKTYEDLPSYLSAFDIAIMPFALNDATKYISPTKTLEYMAAGKAVISTRITDVVRDYSDTVFFADDGQEFAQKIEQILGGTTAELRSSYREILDNTSWASTAAKMNTLIKSFAK